MLKRKSQNIYTKDSIQKILHNYGQLKQKYKKKYAIILIYKQLKTYTRN